MPTSHGSAINLTREDGVGAGRHEERMVRVVLVARPRPKATARSKRKPSTWHSVTQYRRGVQRHSAHDGVPQVEGVAAAGHVDVLAALVEPVVGAVVQATEERVAPSRLCSAVWL